MSSVNDLLLSKVDGIVGGNKVLKEDVRHYNVCVFYEIIIQVGIDN